MSKEIADRAMRKALRYILSQTQEKAIYVHDNVSDRNLIINITNDGNMSVGFTEADGKDLSLIKLTKIVTIHSLH